MEFQILGIDIAKNKFDCSFIAEPNSPDGRKAKSKVLPNNPAGFAQLVAYRRSVSLHTRGCRIQTSDLRSCCKPLARQSNPHTIKAA